MTIHWFPGHMNKARREIAAAMRETDLVIEVLDARLPASSANPMLDELRGGRPCVKVLAKADLADAAITRAWLRHLDDGDAVRCVAARATSATEVRPTTKIGRALCPGRGRPGRPVRALVVGIPNVGKSTLINSLKGRKVAKVENRPAVTRQRQRVDLDPGFSLHDTPGILWPKLEDQVAAKRLAASGGIGDAAFEPRDVATFAIEFLAHRYPKLLQARYRLESLDAPPEALLDEIARRRGFLAPGGRLDVERAADVLLRELRGGVLGRVSFETPGERDAPR